MVDHSDVTWVTDQDLRVTALSRRLRELVGPAPAGAGDLPVSELFSGQDDPFQVALVAHEWARDGERLEFDQKLAGEDYRVRVQPLHGICGSIVGVLGAARKVEAGETGETLTDRLRALTEAETLSGLGSWNTDLRTGRTIWSQGLRELFGVCEQPPDAAIRDYDHPDDIESIATVIASAPARGTGYRCDHRIVRPDGQTRFVQEQASLHFDERGNAIAVTGSMLDITERKISESRLTYLAHYDAVSNLPNRTLLEERLAASIARAQRGDRLCAVLFLDIDTFKEINDSLGHAAGDELLAAVGSRLQRHVRATDTVARVGGDEFVIVLDNLATNHDAHEGARKILDVFKDPFALAGTRRSVSASVGFSIFPFTARNPQELLNAADAAMYAVKAAGGNAVEPARPQVPQRETRKVSACATISAARLHSGPKASGLASG